MVEESDLERSEGSGIILERKVEERVTRWEDSLIR